MLLFLLIFKGRGLILTWSPCPSFPALCGGGDSFLCASGLCVPGKLQCNGHNDCDDWSDEAHCSRRGAGGGGARGWRGGVRGRGLETETIPLSDPDNRRRWRRLLLVCLSDVSKRGSASVFAHLSKARFR